PGAGVSTGSTGGVRPEPDAIPGTVLSEGVGGLATGGADGGLRAASTGSRPGVTTDSAGGAVFSDPGE
ncbi:MAG: hypothetical protein ACRDPB_03375, partial [Nocardioidaceae bacterium]